MKRISLFTLLALAAANTCGAMEINSTTVNSTTINLVMAVAASKSQAKPILFFNIEALPSKIDLNTGEFLCTSRSLELNDIENRRYKNHQEYLEKYKAIQDKVSPEIWAAESAKYSIQVKPLNDEYRANLIKSDLQKIDVLKKITVIATATAKKMEACGVLSYDSKQFLGSSPHMAFACADPDCDITQEIFDTLNKEYQDSKWK